MRIRVVPVVGRRRDGPRGVAPGKEAPEEAVRRLREIP